MKRLLLAIAMLVAATGSARAQDLKDRFNIRLIGQGMYATEQQAAIPGTGTEAQVASPYSLAYGDVRAIIDGRRLPGNFELHIDARHGVDAGEDAGLGKQAEPRRGDLDVVFAGHDITHGVAAGLVGRDLARFTGGGIERFDLRIGHYGAALVGYSADDGAIEDLAGSLERTGRQ